MLLAGLSGARVGQSAFGLEDATRQPTNHYGNVAMPISSGRVLPRRFTLKQQNGSSSMTAQRSHHSYCRPAILGVCLSLFSFAAFSTTIPVQNRDFTSQPNTGTIGGSLGGTPFDGPIGSGPWNGSASGILNLAPSPTLTISKNGGAVSGGSATIQGIVNTASTGPVISNSGFFDQTLKKTYDPNSTYTLTAYISSNSFANSGLLASDGVGIALSNGANIVASSATADPSLVSLSPFSSNTYKLALIYITDSNAPAGNINVELFDDPNGLGSAHVFSSVSFSNVDLTEANASATPEPATFALAGMVLLGLGAIKRSRKTVSAAS
jgi:hypothetical protein